MRPRCANPACRRALPVREGKGTDPTYRGRDLRYCPGGACKQQHYRRRKRDRLRVLFSRETDEWGTDAELFAELELELGPFDLDAAATVENAKCARFFTLEDNALAQPWFGVVWLNPPYSKLREFLAKAWHEVAEGRVERVVLLIPSRTDTSAWHDFVERTDGEGHARPPRRRFLRGRKKFVRAGEGGARKRGGAPFPSAVVVFEGGFRNAAAVTKTHPVRDLGSPAREVA